MPNLFHPLLSVATASTEIFFQTACAHCHQPCTGGLLCQKCQIFDPVEPPLCERCGHSLSQALSHCGYCAKNFPLEALRSTYWLRGAARTLLLRAKYEHSWEELDLLLKAIPSVPYKNLTDAILVPVPLDKNRLIQRGFNQAEILAKGIASMNSLPMIPILRKKRATEVQSLLPLTDRSRNLKNAFDIVPLVSMPKQVVLIDDVYTSGRTLAECATTLKKGGVEKIWGWTLFRTPS